MKVSVVIPAYNEEATFMLLRERLSAVIAAQREYEFEVVLVDDHSTDATAKLIQDWVNTSGYVRGVRLARNGGSHAAVTAGLAHCTGDCAVVLAADLQDPPELLRELLATWRSGYDVVWAVRSGRRGISWRTQLCSRLYWAMMRTVALPETPAQGADVVLLDRKVIAALLAIREKNTSLLSLIVWLGFRQTHISYVKDARAAGTSHWTLARRFKLALDSLLSFSSLPIRLTWICGLLFLAGAAIFAIALVAGWLIGGWHAEPASTAIIGLLLVGFGVLLTFLGAAGEYLWRAYDEIRGRPRYVVERLFEPQVTRFVSDPGLATPRSDANAAQPVTAQLCPAEQEA
jgi:polyisoprenyl-phosphate glycosyltransferase